MGSGQFQVDIFCNQGRPSPALQMAVVQTSHPTSSASSVVLWRLIKLGYDRSKVQVVSEVVRPSVSPALRCQRCDNPSDVTVLVSEGYLPSLTPYGFQPMLHISSSRKGVWQAFFWLFSESNQLNDGGVPRSTYKHGEGGLAYLALGASSFHLLSISAIVMPVATLKDGSLCFSYEDSGPVPMGEPYTTLVMVHGTGFHSGKWAC